MADATNTGAEWRRLAACLDCGQPFKRYRPNNVRCSPCRVIRQREHSQAYRRSMSADQLDAKRDANRAWRLKNKEALSARRSTGIGRGKKPNGYPGTLICPNCKIEVRRMSGRQILCASCAASHTLLRARVKTRIRKALLGARRGARLHEALGYNIDDLRLHLERQFLPGMNWVNFGKWEIDHIVPVAHFQFSLIVDAGFVACFALSNLRPLWAPDNRKKAAKREFLL